MVEPLELSMQGTPNPNAAKFLLNRAVATEGKTYREASSAASEWVKAILGIAGVTQIFVLQHFVTVTKTPDAEWNAIGPQVERILRQAFS